MDPWLADCASVCVVPVVAVRLFALAGVMRRAVLYVCKESVCLRKCACAWCLPLHFRTPYSLYRLRVNVCADVTLEQVGG